jgi:hypothetical protein
MGLGTAVAIAGLGMSAYQGIKGAQATAAANSAAEDAANQAARIAEADRFKSLQVPTLGLELAQQNAQMRQAADIQALQEGGAVTTLGGMTRSNLLAQQQDLQLAANADQMAYQRDLAQAQNAQQIEQGRMQREYAMNQARLAGSQSAAAEGRQQVNAAIQGGLGALSNAAMLKTYKDIYGGTPPPDTNQGGGVKNFFNKALGLGDYAKNKMAQYPVLNATGTPVSYNTPDQMGSVAGLTNQFAAMQSPMPQPQQLFENALTQGTPSYPYPMNWMIQNQNLSR